MNKFISRPARAALPLALAMCTQFFPDSGTRVLQLAVALILARLCSLCPGAALRGASGSIINQARLRGNFITALGMAIIGGVLSVLLCSLGIPYLSSISLECAIAGALINIVQLCSDSMYIDIRGHSPALFDLLAAVLTAVGILISGRDSWLLPVSIIPVIIAALILLHGLRSGSSIKPGFRMFSGIPLALLNNLVVPAFLIGYTYYYWLRDTALVLTFVALALYEFCEAPFRRSEEESSLLSSGITLITVIAAICAWTIPSLSAMHMSCIFFACMGIAFTGLHINLLRLGMLLVYESLIVFAIYPFGKICFPATIALCVVLVALCIPDFISVRRILRARRLQRRRA